MPCPMNDATFYGLPVVHPRIGAGRAELGPDVAARLWVGRREADRRAFGALFAEMLAAPGAEALRALVIGQWGPSFQNDSRGVVERLVAFAPRLPALEALFIGDIASEEAEISWIGQSDLAPLWPAFPELRFFGVRGGANLRFGRLAHTRLERLVVETGGLSAVAVREAVAAETPALTHFELWLGDHEYGGDSAPEDLAPVLSGAAFPALKTLALRNCEYADDLAAALAEAPILARIETLDLSLGALGDAGAEALLASPHIAKLKTLDLHHHYLSDAMMARVAAKLGAAGVAVDLDEQEEDDYGRYVALSE